MAMDWYVSLQSFIDMFFGYLPILNALGFVAVLMLLVKKMMPKTGKKKGGWF